MIEKYNENGWSQHTFIYLNVIIVHDYYNRQLSILNVTVIKYNEELGCDVNKKGKKKLSRFALKFPSTR